MTIECVPPVLVAEDNPTNQIAMKALLNHFGVSADFVCNGKQAVEASKSKHYRLIFMDLMMPVMDGFDAAKRIRENEYATGLRTPIVAVTAMDKSTSKIRCVEAGMDDYISKPIDHKALKFQLERWLLPPVNAIGDLADSQRISTISREGMQDLYASHEAIGEILDSFIIATEEMLESLRVAIESEDPSMAGHITHEVKGSSLAVNAETMVHLAAELEYVIRQENWVEVVRTYHALASAFKLITAALKTPVAVVLQNQPK